MASMSILVLFLALSCLTLIARRCWNAFTSPLNAAKDAHWSVRFSGAWIWYHRVLEQDARAVHEAHQRLGPVIRLAPGELSVNDVDGGLKPIYEGRLPKTDLYQAANSYGEEPMVALRDEESHRYRKRMLAKPYGKSYLMDSLEWHAEQSKLAEDLNSLLEHWLSNDIDLYDILFAWSASSISPYLFGRNASFNLLRDIPQARKIREDYYGQRAWQLVGVVLPIPTTVFAWLGYGPDIEFIRRLQDTYEDELDATSPEQQDRGSWQTVYTFMKRSMLASSKAQDMPANTRLSTKETSVISAEMQDHFIAGIDTSLAALTACAYLLSLEHNRHWQERIRKEVLSISQSTNRHCDLDQLGALNAVIKETLRLYPPAAGGQPRVTDKTVVLGPSGHEVTVPTGVKVHCQARSLHRSAIFSDPESFKPERWLDSSPEMRKEMERWFWAFGSGSRGCVGEHLALSNLRVAVATIWGGFETYATENTRFAVSQGFIAMPLPKDGAYIRLRVQKVED